MLNAYEDDENADVDVDAIDLEQSAGDKLRKLPQKQTTSFLEHKPDFRRDDSKFKKLPILS